jgi:hypothetical protein
MEPRKQKTASRKLQRQPYGVFLLMAKEKRAIVFSAANPATKGYCLQELIK